MRGGLGWLWCDSGFRVSVLYHFLFIPDCREQLMLLRGVEGSWYYRYYRMSVKKLGWGITLLTFHTHLTKPQHFTSLTRIRSLTPQWRSLFLPLQKHFQVPQMICNSPGGTHTPHWEPTSPLFSSLDKDRTYQSPLEAPHNWSIPPNSNNSDFYAWPDGIISYYSYPSQHQFCP